MTIFRIAQQSRRNRETAPPRRPGPVETCFWQRGRSELLNQSLLLSSLASASSRVSRERARREWLWKIGSYCVACPPPIRLFRSGTAGPNLGVHLLDARLPPYFGVCLKIRPKPKRRQTLSFAPIETLWMIGRFPRRAGGGKLSERAARSTREVSPVPNPTSRRKCSTPSRARAKSPE